MDAQAAVQRQQSSAFDIGLCRVEPERNRIVCRGNSVHVEPRVMDLLLVLWSFRGEVASKEQLIQQVWQGAFMTDHVVTHAIWQLRRALRDPRLIQSIPKRGYRLAVEVADPNRDASEHSASPAISQRRSSVVVLPFANLSGDPELEYFTDGMTDALTCRLAQFSFLRVISRTSSLHYRNRAKPIQKIASELDVDTVVEGTVLRDRSRVRISIQLINARTETHLWAGTYDRDLSDVLELQSDLAEVIASRVSATLGIPSPPIASSPVVPEAYEAYLRGRFCWMRFSPENFDAALNFFQQAAQLDSTFAQPLSGIAQVWFARENTGAVRPAEAAPLAREAARQALLRDENSADAHAAMGLIRFHFDWDHSTAEADFRKAVELNPNDSATRIFLSDLLFSTERPADGFEHIEYALRIDPLSPAPRCFLGWYMLFLRQVDEAIAELRKAIEIEPAYGAAHQALWGAWYLREQWHAALSEAITFFSVRGQGSLIPLLPPPVTEHQYRQTMYNAARQLVEMSRSSYIRNLHIARLYAHAGEREDACAYLEKACSEKESPLVHLAVGWDWDAVRADTRFRSVVKRIGFQQASQS